MTAQPYLKRGVLMEPADRDELHAALEAAGCHRLASRVCYFDDPMVAELRSLLRRKERLRVMEAGVRAAEWLLEGVTCYPDDPMVKALNAATKLLETEVPDGQG